MENNDVLTSIGASQTTTTQDPCPEVRQAFYEDEFRRAQKTLAAMDANRDESEQDDEPLTWREAFGMFPESDDEILDDLRGDNPPRCKACGVAYIDHLGHEGLCYKLREATVALVTIAMSQGVDADYLRSVASECWGKLEATR